ncbi:methionyl/Leucyl tRNA synthetase [Kipferlia bialata]|uniref:Methionyl/Leucyl tRNA synthetase n=1 Tax=Kipferlia bialata TaxID=797122 RepID=A0A9K3D4N0_9EUKA|nr:methionyl/Leucyl tRNA synthetase [Kipferlia bialata]|eukprot:g11393.t1
MEFYHPQIRDQFERVLGWLHHWACTRSFGLGTAFPIVSDDCQTQVIESLSDSTIYNAFYTVSGLLQGPDNLEGKKLGPLGITADMVDDSLWDAIFLRAELPEGHAVSQEQLHKLCSEFEYWYPVNLRVSGKDLVPNHLTMYMYNHAAIWDKDPSKWPRGIRANGHIQVDNEKMSKSVGNFITAAQAMDMYSADGLRFGLADSGDSVEDANFVCETAERAVSKLTSLLDWCKDATSLADKGELRVATEAHAFDSVFKAEMDTCVLRAIEAYDQCLFREALVQGFHELSNARDRYAQMCVSMTNMRSDLVMRYVEMAALCLAPICPHVAEEIWTYLNKPECLHVSGRFPSKDSLRATVDACQDMMEQYKVGVVVHVAWLL